VSCEVRNELNGRRGGQDVVTTIPDNLPYMPRRFPAGRWKIGTPVKKTSPYTKPWFIPTDAWQMVSVWLLDENGFYDVKSNREIKDTAYGLHASNSRTTLGCLKIMDIADVEWLAREILADADAILEVV
jgi:hypothetical protein